MIKFNKVRIIVLILLTAAAGFPAVSEYLNLSIGLDTLWMLLLPVILYVRKHGELSVRYFFAAVASLAGNLLAPSPIFLLFAAFFTVFFILESRFGKLNRLAPLLVVLITPLTKYLLDLFGFPVRLALTEVASASLNAFGLSNHAQGNSIIVNGDEFTVDPACMGLKMVITSLLLCLLLVSWFEKRSKVELPIAAFSLAVAWSLILVMTANLLRIILLLLFGFPPETFGHEATGIMILLTAVLIPQYVAIKFLMKKFGIKWNSLAERKFSSPSNFSVALCVPLILLLGFFSWSYQPGRDIPKDSAAASIEISGYRKEILPNNVIRLTGDAAIIYVKPCKGIFRSDHHPALCWRGSGFEFLNEKIIEFNGAEIHTARLVSENKAMHTAWWYDNGRNKTISQLGWRWQMLQGAPPFRLVNITADTRERLMLEINNQWNKDLFSSATTAAAY